MTISNPQPKLHEMTQDELNWSTSWMSENSLSFSVDENDAATKGSLNWFRAKHRKWKRCYPRDKNPSLGTASSQDSSDSLPPSQDNSHVTSIDVNNSISSFLPANEGHQTAEFATSSSMGENVLRDESTYRNTEANPGTSDRLASVEVEILRSGQSNDYQQHLVEFYSKHNPAKLDSVDATLASYRGREELLFRKLNEKYVTGKDGILPAQGSGPLCFLEFRIGNDSQAKSGRVTVKLYQDKAPLAAENFRCLCTGERGFGGRSRKPLCYRGSKIHRIVPNFCIQGGDFTKGDGTGGESIYAPSSEYGDMWGKFKDETPFLQHSRKGLLSMANCGPNTNGSQFFITLRSLPHLDGKHVVFGEVVSGMEIVEEIGRSETNQKQYPHQTVLITDCGQITGIRREEELQQQQLACDAKSIEASAQSTSETNTPSSANGANTSLNSTQSFGEQVTTNSHDSSPQSCGQSCQTPFLVKSRSVLSQLSPNEALHSNNILPNSDGSRKSCAGPAGSNHQHPPPGVSESLPSSSVKSYNSGQDPESATKNVSKAADASPLFNTEAECEVESQQSAIFDERESKESRKSAGNETRNTQQASALKPTNSGMNSSFNVEGSKLSLSGDEYPGIDVSFEPEIANEASSPFSFSGEAKHVLTEVVESGNLIKKEMTKIAYSACFEVTEEVTMSTSMSPEKALPDSLASAVSVADAQENTNTEDCPAVPQSTQIQDGDISGDNKEVQELASRLAPQLEILDALFRNTDYSGTKSSSSDRSRDTEVDEDYSSSGSLDRELEELAFVEESLHKELELAANDPSLLSSCKSSFESSAQEENDPETNPESLSEKTDDNDVSEDCYDGLTVTSSGKSAEPKLTGMSDTENSESKNLSDNSGELTLSSSVDATTQPTQSLPAALSPPAADAPTLPFGSATVSCATAPSSFCSVAWSKASPAAALPAFSFGNTPSVLPDTMAKPNLSFSFGTRATTTAPAEKKQAAALPAFSPNAPSVPPNTMANSNPSSVSFSFGAHAATTAQAEKEPAAALPAFSFENAPSVPPDVMAKPDPSSGSFSFGTYAATTAPAEKEPAAALPAFSFGNASSVPPSPAGCDTMVRPKPSSVSFSFGTHATTTAPAESLCPGRTAAKPELHSGRFSFGSNNAKPAPQSGTFSFGITPCAPEDQAGTFSVGSIHPEPAHSSKSFSFGVALGDPAPKIGSYSFGSTRSTTSLPGESFSPGTPAAVRALPKTDAQVFSFPNTAAAHAPQAGSFSAGRTPAASTNSGSLAPAVSPSTNSRDAKAVKSLELQASTDARSPPSPADMLWIDGPVVTGGIRELGEGMAKAEADAVEEEYHDSEAFDGVDEATRLRDSKGSIVKTKATLAYRGLDALSNPLDYGESAKLSPPKDASSTAAITGCELSFENCVRDNMAKSFCPDITNVSNLPKSFSDQQTKQSSEATIKSEASAVREESVERLVPKPDVRSKTDYDPEVYKGSDPGATDGKNDVVEDGIVGDTARDDDGATDGTMDCVDDCDCDGINGLNDGAAAGEVERATNGETRSLKGADGIDVANAPRVKDEAPDGFDDDTLDGVVESTVEGDDAGAAEGPSNGRKDGFGDGVCEDEDGVIDGLKNVIIVGKEEGIKGGMSKASAEDVSAKTTGSGSDEFTTIETVGKRFLDVGAISTESVTAASPLRPENQSSLPAKELIDVESISTESLLDEQVKIPEGEYPKTTNRSNPDEGSHLGQMVLVMNEDLPPQKLHFGRTGPSVEEQECLPGNAVEAMPETFGHDIINETRTIQSVGAGMEFHSFSTTKTCQELKEGANFLLTSGTPELLLCDPILDRIRPSGGTFNGWKCGGELDCLSLRLPSSVPRRNEENLVDKELPPKLPLQHSYCLKFDSLELSLFLVGEGLLKPCSEFSAPQSATKKLGSPSNVQIGLTSAEDFDCAGSFKQTNTESNRDSLQEVPSNTESNKDFLDESLAEASGIEDNTYDFKNLENVRAWESSEISSNGRAICAWRTIVKVGAEGDNGQSLQNESRQERHERQPLNEVVRTFENGSDSTDKHQNDAEPIIENYPQKDLSKCWNYSPGGEDCYSGERSNLADLTEEIERLTVSGQVSLRKSCENAAIKSFDCCGQPDLADLPTQNNGECSNKEDPEILRQTKDFVQNINVVPSISQSPKLSISWRKSEQDETPERSRWCNPEQDETSELNGSQSAADDKIVSSDKSSECIDQEDCAESEQPSESCSKLCSNGTHFEFCEQSVNLYHCEKDLTIDIIDEASSNESRGRRTDSDRYEEECETLSPRRHDTTPGNASVFHEEDERLCDSANAIGANDLLSRVEPDTIATQMTSNEQLPRDSCRSEKESDKRHRESKNCEKAKDLSESANNLVVKTQDHEVQSEVKNCRRILYRQNVVEDTWSRLCKELREDRKRKKERKKTESERQRAVLNEVGFEQPNYSGSSLMKDALTDILAERIFTDNELSSKLSIEQIEVIMGLSLDGMVSVLRYFELSDTSKTKFTWHDIEKIILSEKNAVQPPVEKTMDLSGGESDSDGFKTCLSSIPSSSSTSSEDEDTSEEDDTSNFTPFTLEAHTDYCSSSVTFHGSEDSSCESSDSSDSYEEDPNNLLDDTIFMLSQAQDEQAEFDFFMGL